MKFELNIRSLEAEAAPVPRVGDGEQREEVAADAQDDVERVEDHGDGDEADLVLDAGVAVGGRVVAHADVAVLDYARSVADGDHDHVRHTVFLSSGDRTLFTIYTLLSKV